MGPPVPYNAVKAPPITPAGIAQPGETGNFYETAPFVGARGNGHLPSAQDVRPAGGLVVNKKPRLRGLDSGGNLRASLSTVGALEAGASAPPVYPSVTL